MLVCLRRTRRGPRCLPGGRAPGTPTYEGRRWPHPPASRVAVGRHPPASGASASHHAVARGVLPRAAPPAPPRTSVVLGRTRLPLGRRCPHARLSSALLRPRAPSPLAPHGALPPSSPSACGGLAAAPGVFPGAGPPHPPRPRVAVGRIRLLRGSPLAAIRLLP